MSHLHATAELAAEPPDGRDGTSANSEPAARDERHRVRAGRVDNTPNGEHGKGDREGERRGMHHGAAVYTRAAFGGSHDNAQGNDATVSHFSPSTPRTAMWTHRPEPSPIG